MVKQSKSRYVGYLWNVLVNIFTIIVVLSIFSKVHSSFETIVLSIAVLIYIQLVTFSSIWGLQTQTELFALNEEFKRMRRLMKEQLSDDDEEYEKEQLDESKAKFEKQQVKFYINGIFAFIVYIIAILNLLGAL